MVAILVVATFLVFILIDVVYKQHPSLSGSMQAARSSGWRPTIRPGYFYTPNHLWLSLDPSGMLTLGADDLFHRIFGVPDAIQLKKPGDRVHRGDRLAQFLKGERTLAVSSPVSGVIQSTNDQMQQHPDQFARGAYDAAWLYLMRPTAFAKEMLSFKVAEDARPWMVHEVNRLSAFLRTHQGETLSAPSNHNGMLAENLLTKMDAPSVTEFEQEFLLNLESR